MMVGGQTEGRAQLSSTIIDYHEPFDQGLTRWQTRKHCCGNIVANDVSLRAQTGERSLRTQNVSEQNQTFLVSRTQTLCPQQMLRSRANGETFVSATMCPQQWFLVCQGLYTEVLKAASLC